MVAGPGRPRPYLGMIGMGSIGMHMALAAAASMEPPLTVMVVSDDEDVSQRHHREQRRRRYREGYDAHYEDWLFEERKRRARAERDEQLAREAAKAQPFIDAAQAKRLRKQAKRLKR